MKKYLWALVLGLVLIALSLRLYIGDRSLLLISALWSGCVAYLYFKCANRTNLYRTIFFSIIAVTFLLEMHTFANAGATTLPYCHIGMAGNVMHTAYNQVLAIINSNWQRYGALSIGILWLLVLLVAGQSFCGWICFLGGVDNLFSQVLKKPLIKLHATKRFREFQIAFFIFITFMSLFYIEPVFCRWFCPYKISNYIFNPNDGLHTVQIIVTIFVSVVIVFLASIIFRKRAFCSTLCPFGALPPMIHKISPYKMKIDQDKCVKCDLCFKECPSFAIDRTDNVYSITRYCNLCYRCVRECKYDAITTNRLTPFISLLIGGALSLFYVPSAIRHLLQLMGV